MTDNLDQFIAALNGLIESAHAYVQESDSFLAVNQDIQTLIERDLPPLVEALSSGDPEGTGRARLEESLAALRELETAGRARVVWGRDFEDYMRRSLSEDG